MIHFKIDLSFYQTVEQARNLPLFYQSAWWDLVSQSHEWQPMVLLKKDHPVGVFPHLIRKKGFFDAIVPPVLTPFSGPFLFKDDKLSTRETITHENVSFQAVCQYLDQFDFVELQLHPNFQNCLPFIWSGYKITPKYTFRINYNKWDESNLNRAVRRHIKSSKQLCTIGDSKEFLEDIKQNCELVFTSKGMKMPFSKAVIDSLYQFALQHDSIDLVAIKKKDGAFAASLLCLKDDEYAYNLFCCGSNDFKKLNASAWLTTMAILEAKEQNLSFDFEGSMIPGVHNFFKGFGGELQTYFKLNKTNSRIIRIFQKLGLRNA